MNVRNQLRKQNKDEEFGNLTLLKKKQLEELLIKMILRKIILKITGRKSGR